MDNIIVISQNLKLESIGKLCSYLMPGSVLIVSTQKIFENEEELINNQLGRACSYKTFADLLKDEERAKVDEDAFNPNKQKDVNDYYDDIKTLKNHRIIINIEKIYPCENKFILCDDLGIAVNEWIKAHYKWVECDYYNVATHKRRNPLVKVIRRVGGYLLKPYFIAKKTIRKKLYVAKYEGTKYLFYGSMNRIAYRFDLAFNEANRIDMFIFIIHQFGIIWPSKTVHISTLHEGYHAMPDNKNLNVKLIQDGYLPPNYSSKYLKFYGRYTEFYTWDHIGRDTFFFHSLPNRIIPI